jgi:multimeric flavodoxin WrbA
MKAIILLATLKKSPTISNTDVLCSLLIEELSKHKVESEVIRLVDFNIPPGLKSNMGKGDDWPKILDKMMDSAIVIFATPVWWGVQSSLMQRVIERMDELNDELLKMGKSDFANKIGGIVITGGEDGAQHIIGNICNFMSWNGFTIPPACSLSYLGEADGKTQAATLAKMKKEDEVLVDNAKVMASNLAFFANLLTENPIPTL